MLTFKQFMEGEALDDLAIEMAIRKEFDVDQHMAEVILKWMRHEEVDDDDGDDAYNIVAGHYDSEIQHQSDSFSSSADVERAARRIMRREFKKRYDLEI